MLFDDSKHWRKIWNYELLLGVNTGNTGGATGALLDFFCFLRGLDDSDFLISFGGSFQPAVIFFRSGLGPVGISLGAFFSRGSGGKFGMFGLLDILRKKQFHSNLF